MKKLFITILASMFLLPSFGCGMMGLMKDTLAESQAMGEKMDKTIELTTEMRDTTQGMSKVTEGMAESTAHGMEAQEEAIREQMIAMFKEILLDPNEGFFTRVKAGKGLLLATTRPEELVLQLDVDDQTFPPTFNDAVGSPFTMNQILSNSMELKDYKKLVNNHIIKFPHDILNRTAIDFIEFSLGFRGKFALVGLWGEQMQFEVLSVDKFKLLVENLETINEVFKLMEKLRGSDVTPSRVQKYFETIDTFRCTRFNAFIGNLKTLIIPKFEEYKKGLYKPYIKILDVKLADKKLMTDGCE